MSARGGRRRIVAVVVILAVVIALIAVLGSWAKPYLERFGRWVDELGPAGPIVFIAGYAAATVALIPASVLTLAAGAVFGLWRGIAYVFVAASLGAALAFLVSRYVVRRWVERRLADRPDFDAVQKAIAERGLVITFLLRLAPIYPFNFLNYALGLTRVSFLHYNIASLGMLPGTVLYVYLGSAAKDVAGGGGDAGWQKWAIRGGGLVLTIIVTVLAARIARKALKKADVDRSGGEGG